MDELDKKKLFEKAKKDLVEAEKEIYMWTLFKDSEIIDGYSLIKLYIKDGHDDETDLDYESIVLEYVFENYEIKNMRHHQYNYGLDSHFEIVVKQDKEQGEQQ